ncbi:GAP family protein [Rhodococcus zopfii]|uniref:GAP family protein n=1 Tax=Rhodococcus zopfii TaxID=43772 RepID=UPI00093363AF|nr:GAP family protein [Rhodococcus zopfii]
MNTTIGDLLPLAIAIAISPVAIIATILMLMGPRARILSPCFLVGWVLGVLAATVVFTLLAGVLPESSSDSKPLVGALRVLLGLALLGLSVRQWRSRPRSGSEPSLPAWMSTVDTMRPAAAMGTAALLAAVNPKNLLLTVTAGSVLGSSGLGTGGVVVCGAVFVAVASASIALPTIAYLVSPGRAEPVLASLRSWLVANNTAIMCVLLIVLGTKLLGDGIGAL